MTKNEMTAERLIAARTEVAADRVSLRNHLLFACGMMVGGDWVGCAAAIDRALIELFPDEPPPLDRLVGPSGKGGH